MMTKNTTDNKALEGAMDNKVTRFTLREGVSLLERMELHRAGCRHLTTGPQPMGQKLHRFAEGVSAVKIAQVMYDEVRWMDGHPGYEQIDITVMSCCKMKAAEKRAVVNAPVADSFDPNVDFSSGQQWDKSVFDFDALTDAQKAEWRNSPYVDPRTGEDIPY